MGSLPSSQLRLLGFGWPRASILPGGASVLPGVREGEACVHESKGAGQSWAGLAPAGGVLTQGHMEDPVAAPPPPAQRTR